MNEPARRLLNRLCAALSRAASGSPTAMLIERTDDAALLVTATADVTLVLLASDPERLPDATSIRTCWLQLITHDEPEVVVPIKALPRHVIFVGGPLTAPITGPHFLDGSVATYGQVGLDGTGGIFGIMGALFALALRSDGVPRLKRKAIAVHAASSWRSACSGRSRPAKGWRRTWSSSRRAAWSG